MAMSALVGDNVVEQSANMPWHSGPTLLDHLETVPVFLDAELDRPLRLPVHYVIRPKSEAHHDYRGYAGGSSAAPCKSETSSCSLRSADEGRRDRHLGRPG